MALLTSEGNGGTDSFPSVIPSQEGDLDFGLRQSQARAKVSVPRTPPVSGCPATLFLFLFYHTKFSQVCFLLSPTARGQVHCFRLPHSQGPLTFLFSYSLTRNASVT